MSSREGGLCLYVPDDNLNDVSQLFKQRNSPFALDEGGKSSHILCILRGSLVLKLVEKTQKTLFRAKLGFK